jgi:hypothetical protein
LINKKDLQGFVDLFFYVIPYPDSSAIPRRIKKNNNRLRTELVWKAPPQRLFQALSRSFSTEAAFRVNAKLSI